MKVVFLAWLSDWSHRSEPGLRRSSYVLNSGVFNLEDADVLLLVGTDPRTEAPVLNARLRRAAVYGGLKVSCKSQDSAPL